MIRPPQAQKFMTMSKNKEDTPGPGTYMLPSDFGNLELYKFSPRTS